MSTTGLALSWSFGNEKINRTRHSVAWGLPAFESQDGFRVCPGAGTCAKLCYARQGNFVRPVVQAARERNLTAARSADFAALLSWDLQTLSQKYRVAIVRVHDGGDFFSQEYFNAWAEAARKHPEITFYAYTKSHHLDFSARPENLVLTASLGGKFDELALASKLGIAKIFPTHAERKRAGYKDGTHTDALAIRGEERIGLVYHGTRRLSEVHRLALQSVRDTRRKRARTGKG